MTALLKTVGACLHEDRLRRMMTSYEGPKHSVVGLIYAKGRTSFIGAGVQAPDIALEDQIFEIGSITKVFTAILLCLLVEEGKIDPRAPLAEMSDALSNVPPWITPERLVSHTSGLPNIYVPIWKALFQQLPEGPYAGFSRSDLLSWLHRWRGKDPGMTLKHRYSNLGIGLLGEAMAIQQGQPFRALLADRVLYPLRLKDTTRDLDACQDERFMQPRNTNGKPVVPWSFDALAGAGYLRSTAHDLGRFAHRVIQAINDPKTPLDHAIKRSSEPIFGLGRGGKPHPLAQCAGWVAIMNTASEPGVLLANGGTAGSTCALYIHPGKAAAIGILSNNGVAANLWTSLKLDWSDQIGQAEAMFT